MTVQTTSASQGFVGNGVTKTFPCSFKVFDQTHLDVYLDGVLQTLTTHYTVSGVGNDVTDVVFVTAPANQAAISVFRKVPLTQLVDYLPNDEFPAETHERALDLVTMGLQQVDALARRAVRTREEDPAGIDMRLPPVDDRASKLLAFDSDGQPVAASGTSFGMLTTSEINTWTAEQRIEVGLDTTALRISDLSGNDLIRLRHPNDGGGAVVVLDDEERITVLLDGENADGEVLELTDFDTGGVTFRPVLALFRDAPGGVDKLLGRVEFKGRDSASNEEVFAAVDAQIAVATSGAERGRLVVRLPVDGVEKRIFRVGAGYFAEFQSDADGIGVSPLVSLWRNNPNPVNGADLGIMLFAGNNDAAQVHNFGSIYAVADNIADGSEEGHVVIEASVAGALPGVASFRSNELRLEQTGVRWIAGAGSPEGAVSAPVGSFYSRTDGGVGTSFYVKESGAGNTGWAAK